MIKVRVQNQTPVSVGLSKSAPVKVGIGTVVATGNGGIDVSGASVGQIIKIAAVDNDGKPTAWKPADLPEQVQADWFQNDSSAVNYVNGRTHSAKLKELQKFSIKCVTSDSSYNYQKNIYKFSNIPEFICVEIEGIRFFNPDRNSNYIGDSSYSIWADGGGYGFSIKKEIDDSIFVRTDPKRFSLGCDFCIYEIVVEKQIPYQYLPIPYLENPGVVRAHKGENSLISDYFTGCLVDENGYIYSRKYEPAKIYSTLSVRNMLGLLNVGDHAIFTDTVDSEVLSDVGSLTLPVHAWRLNLPDRTYKYLLESADAKAILIEIVVGNTIKIVSSTILYEQKQPPTNLIVTVKQDEPGYATHTPNEIYEAIMNGQNVQFVVDSQVGYPCIICDDYAIFSFLLIDAGLAGISSISIETDGSLHHILDNFKILYPMILNSSTDGSSKQFMITVDDSGTISAVEVT